MPANDEDILDDTDVGNLAPPPPPEVDYSKYYYEIQLPAPPVDEQPED